MKSVLSRTKGCLFCGNVNGRFTSVEHIILKTLGNSVGSGLVDEEIVLPPGVVCDKCNGKRLQRCDKALAGWPPISVFRWVGLIVNGNRKLVDAVKETAWKIDFDPSNPLVFSLSFEAKTDPASRRDDVARALCKVALETHWLSDPDDAESSRWDPIAAAALGGPLPAQLSLGLVQPTSPSEMSLTPYNEVLVDPDSASLRFVCRLEVVGLELLLFVGLAPAALPNTTWWVLNEATGTLEGPNLMYGTFGATATEAHRISKDEAETRPGKSSHLPTHGSGPTIRVMRGTAPPAAD
jgi:hypothetical protein